MTKPYNLDSVSEEEAEKQKAPRGRGRLPGFTMSNAHRLKIQKSNILSVLIQHGEGTREMSSTQVAACLGLLKKCLPDLSSVELKGDADSPLQVMVQKFTGDD